MENSYKYFENKACNYYPCHQGMHTINCLFCYCPLYPLTACPGEYTHIDANEKKVKDCTNCTFPHKAENYDRIVAILSEQSGV